MTSTLGGLPAAVAHFFNATTAGDAGAWVAAFASDAVINDPVGSPTLHGREALRAQMAQILPQLADFSGLVPEQAYVCGSSTAVHWRAAATSSTGSDLAWSGISAFELDASGDISQLNVWFDPSLLS